MINFSINSNELHQIIANVVRDVLKTEFENINNESATEPTTLLKTNDIADLLKVSPLTIKLWKRDGKIPYRKIGRLVYYDKNDVLNSVNKYQNVKS